MSEREHTPAPWRWMGDALVGDHGKRPVVICPSIVRDASGEPTSASQMMERGDDGRLHPLDPHGPNATLIAAAPDLLALVLELRRVVLGGHTVSHQLHARTDEVIAKATGGA